MNDKFLLVKDGNVYRVLHVSKYDGSGIVIDSIVVTKRSELSELITTVEVVHEIIVNEVVYADFL